jgi:putative heme iron utilization protein
VFFISLMAEHTKNLELDARASLLVAETGHSDPLANGRVMLLGTARRLAAGADGSPRAAYLAAHPNASYYVDYADFAFWRLDVESARYIGGYGRMSWVELEEYRSALPDPIAPHAAGILDHTNADHAAALADYCHAFTKATDAPSAVMTAIDRYGFEMSAVTERGPRPIRLAFPAPISTAAGDLPRGVDRDGEEGRGDPALLPRGGVGGADDGLGRGLRARPPRQPQPLLDRSRAEGGARAGLRGADGGDAGEARPAARGGLHLRAADREPGWRRC